jgi:hypothetical protein
LQKSFKDTGRTNFPPPHPYTATGNTPEKKRKMRGRDRAPQKIDFSHFHLWKKNKIAGSTVSTHAEETAQDL